MRNRKLIIIAVVLILAIILAGCGQAKKDAESHNFSLTVVDGTGNETKHQITSSKKTVGEALVDNGLISGEQGPYGLYIKSVDGITADYDTDGTYWAFYIDGEYAMSGVDTTDIEDGCEYMLKVEK